MEGMSINGPICVCACTVCLSVFQPNDKSNLYNITHQSFLTWHSPHKLLFQYPEHLASLASNRANWAYRSFSSNTSGQFQDSVHRELYVMIAGKLPLLQTGPIYLTLQISRARSAQCTGCNKLKNYSPGSFCGSFNLS